MYTRKYVPVKEKNSQIYKYPSIKKQINNRGYIHKIESLLQDVHFQNNIMRGSEDPLPSKTNFTGENSLKIYI